MSNVLIIEDNPDIADVVRGALDAGGHATAVACSGGRGLALARRDRPDLVLLDLDLPDADGLDLLPELQTLAPVIVLTGRRSEESVVTGLALGAEDYVTKPFSPRVLLARVEVVLRRRAAGVATRIERGDLVLDLDRREATLDGRPLELTRRELDLLAFLAARPGVVVPRDDLLAAVWQSSAEWQTAATVTEHVRRVRLKLGDVRWIESVRGVGYRFVEPVT
jgi:two-component system, OmpR family, phosphate regulon response regulator PhoB